MLGPGYQPLNSYSCTSNRSRGMGKPRTVLGPSYGLGEFRQIMYFELLSESQNRINSKSSPIPDGDKHLMRQCNVVILHTHMCGDVYVHI